MTDDDAKDAIDYLRACGLASISRGSMWDVEMCTKTIATIERLTAEVARLTPKEMMTNAEVCELLNKHKWLASRRVGDDLTWNVDRFGRFVNCPLDDNGRPLGDSDVLEFQEAVWITQGLERDAGPTVVQEPATQGEVNHD